MTRLARVVVPGLPHHVTQRGNRREPICFADGDQEIYRDLLAEQLRRARVEVWAYCLMPNHVHLVLVPHGEAGLGRAIGEAHRRYTQFRQCPRWGGHLFQSRFASVVMDEAHLYAVARYVATNPVRAGLAARAEDWEGSSVRTHLSGRDDALVTVKPLLDQIPRFGELLDPSEPDDRAFMAIRAAETTGRPLGSADFVADLERRLGRPLARRAPGRKPANALSKQLGLSV